MDDMIFGRMPDPSLARHDKALALAWRFCPEWQQTLRIVPRPEVQPNRSEYAQAYSRYKIVPAIFYRDLWPSSCACTSRGSTPGDGLSVQRNPKGGKKECGST